MSHLPMSYRPRGTSCVVNLKAADGGCLVPERGPEEQPSGTKPFLFQPHYNFVDFGVSFSPTVALP